VRRQDLVYFWWQTSHVGSPLNEWADRLAARYMQDEMPVAVPRHPVSFAAWQWTGARCGVHAWALPRARRAVLKWLQSSVGESQMAEQHTICINGLRPKVARLAEKVRSARVFPGDERMRREMGELCRECDVACPHGCRDDKGVVTFTWWHAAFFCKECDTSDARARFLAVIQEAGGAMRGSGKSGSAEHGQLASLRFWVESGMAWQVALFWANRGGRLATGAPFHGGSS
jgi:hypothetical protein